MVKFKIVSCIVGAVLVVASLIDTSINEKKFCPECMMSNGIGFRSMVELKDDLNNPRAQVWKCNSCGFTGLYPIYPSTKK